MSVSRIDYFIERGEQVDHGAYLRLERVRQRVIDALLSTERPPPGFAFAPSMQAMKQAAMAPFAQPSAA